MKVWSWRNVVAKGKIDPLCKLVLYTLANYMSEAGDCCYPTIETIAAESGLSKTSIHKYLRVAEEAGYLRRSKHGFAGQRWARNEYVATYPSACILDNQNSNMAEEGSKPHLLPLGGEVVNATHEGSKTHSEKVVNHVNTNTPVNTPENTPIVCTQTNASDLRKQQIDGRTTGANTLQIDILPKAWGEYAEKEFGWSRQTVLDVWADFFGYWGGRTSQRYAKHDWPATWRNNCRTNAKRFGYSGGAQQQKNKYNEPLRGVTIF